MSDNTPQHRAETKSPWLSNGVYDVLKAVTTVVLPGVGALYYALSDIWGLPNAGKVVATIAAVVTFLGLFLGTASKNYREAEADAVVGYLDSPSVNEDTGIPDLKLAVTKHPEEFLGNKTVKLKIGTPPPPAQ